MKRITLALFSVITIFSVSGQNLFDALLFGETTLNGTARYMIMGGAFGALGGDPTSILDNPASAAIYRGSEITFTLNAMPSVSYTNW